MNVPGDGEIRLPDFINSNRKYEKIKKLSRMGNHFFDDRLRHYWVHGIRFLFSLFPRRVYCFPLCGESMKPRYRINNDIAKVRYHLYVPGYDMWRNDIFKALNPLKDFNRIFRIKTKI